MKGCRILGHKEGYFTGNGNPRMCLGCLNRGYYGPRTGDSVGSNALAHNEEWGAAVKALRTRKRILALRKIPGVVYATYLPDGNYKVGRGSSAKRAKAAQTFYADDVVVHAIWEVENAQNAERRAHYALAQYRIRGEIFNGPVVEVLTAELGTPTPAWLQL